MRSAPKQQVDQSYVHSLGEAIRFERDSLGYTQEGFAERIGFDRGYMGRVERGESNLTFGKLIIVLRALGAKPRDFFREIHLRGQPRDVSTAPSIKKENAQRENVSDMLGAALKLERHRFELTQEELAARVGKSRSYIISLECGHGNPTFTVLMQILEGLAIEPADFFRHFPLPKRKRPPKPPA